MNVRDYKDVRKKIGALEWFPELILYDLPGGDEDVREVRFEVLVAAHTLTFLRQIAPFSITRL